jgi:hypothetical protein
VAELADVSSGIGVLTIEGGIYATKTTVCSLQSHETLRISHSITQLNQWLII